MEAFIENHQFNIIRNEMGQISKLLKYNGDAMIVESVKESTQKRIEELFTDLSGQALDLLQMSHLREEAEIQGFLSDLEEMTWGMAPVTDGQIIKVFRKEKKLKLPDQGLQSPRHTYLGWKDEGKKKLYILHRVDGKLMGMVCRINTMTVKNTTMCALCGHMSETGEVVNTTVRCKTASAEDYHAIGFNLCSDSRACNRRITEPDRLDRLMRKVTGGK